MNASRSYASIACLVALLTLCLDHSSGFFDPISIGLGSAALGIGYGLFKDQTYCRYAECCDERSIPGNIYRLKTSLKRSLFGQHIVLEQLIPALEAHFSPESKSRKPLVISFHGTAGVGKNFVADHIADALYSRGSKSKFVHKYLGRADFPYSTSTNEYKARVNKEVREALAECPRSLFIFDEVDKMPEGVFESLASLVDYQPLVGKQDNTKAIYIFLSNTAGVYISDRLGKLIKDGTLRDETKLSHFEQILQKAAYNLEGGFKKTSLIESHVIDHYIPFLPLEKSHVYKCLEVEFRKWGHSPREEVINEIIADAVTYDRTHSLFATSGCKTLEKKVAVAVWASKG